MVKEFWNPVWQKKTHPKLLGSKIIFRIAFEIGKMFAAALDPLRAKLNKSSAITDQYKFKNYTTEDPEEICVKLIKDFSKEGDTVLDPFMGSGTVLKIARDLNRPAIGVDVNAEAIKSTKAKLQI